MNILNFSMHYKSSGKDILNRRQQSLREGVPFAFLEGKLLKYKTIFQNCIFCSLKKTRERRKYFFETDKEA